MTKEIRLNGFALFAAVHQQPGLWRHPRNRVTEFASLDYWVELAQLLERGKFDSLFLADSITIPDIYKGNTDEAVRRGMQLPKYDPFLLISALAYSTKHLGFAITASTSFDSPYAVARRFSTLDHITKGRIGWNIVTNTSDGGARAQGRSGVRAHDLRYDIADEFLDGAYKLWEGSWEDDALRLDRESNIFSDPDKVHKVEHDGEHFKFEGVYIVDPSPQRTPYLFQAGTSGRGRDFAARHAESIFIADTNKITLAETVADIRARAANLGRNPGDLKFFIQASPIVGKTQEEAEARLNEYQSYVDLEGGLGFLSLSLGLDLSRYNLDDPFPISRKDNAMHSLSDTIERQGPKTIRDVLMQRFGPQRDFVGDPAQVADQLQSFVDETDVDGFNISYAVSPEGFVDFIDLVVPELQRRNIYKSDYAEGTLREKLGGNALLPPTHPAALARLNLQR